MLIMDAIHYVQTVSYNQENGWGQSISYADGCQSHSLLRHMYQKWGKEEFNKALDILFSKGK